jgi:hypothetical protein
MSHYLGHLFALYPEAILNVHYPLVLIVKMKLEEIHPAEYHY